MNNDEFEKKLNKFGLKLRPNFKLVGDIIDIVKKDNIDDIEYEAFFKNEFKDRINIRTPITLYGNVYSRLEFLKILKLKSFI